MRRTSPFLSSCQEGLSVAYPSHREGVFLDDNQPDLTGAPTALDFSVIGLDFTTLNPVVKQAFVPEPGTLALLGVGVLALRRRRAAKPLRGAGVAG